MNEAIQRWLNLENAPRRTIWQMHDLVTRRLLWWAALNVVLGVWLQQRRNKFWRGVGMQSLSWGVINAMIAIIGGGVTRARYANMENPNQQETVQKERRNLLRALWVNAGLDVFYVLGGVVLALTKGSKDRLMRGNGWGIVVQGGFLFLFDLVHALILQPNDDE